MGPAAIRAFQVNHWGARMRNDTYRGYNGYTIDVGRRRILFGGDTAVTTAFRAVRTSRPFDLAIMPVARTTRGSTITAHPSRHGKWRTTPAPSSSCPCTTRHSR